MAARSVSLLSTAALLWAAVLLSAVRAAAEESTPTPGVSVSGVMRGESGTLVGLQRVDGDRETRWVAEGEAFAGWTFVRFEPGEQPRIVLSREDREVMLDLRASTPTEALPPAPVPEAERLRHDFPLLYLLSQTVVAGAKAPPTTGPTSSEAPPPTDPAGGGKH